MRRLEISRLMDEYVDNEFFPQDREAADAQAVKARVLAAQAAETGAAGGGDGRGVPIERRSRFGHNNYHVPIRYRHHSER